MELKIVKQQTTIAIICISIEYRHSEQSGSRMKMDRESSVVFIEFERIPHVTQCKPTILFPGKNVLMEINLNFKTGYNPHDMISYTKIGLKDRVI